MFWNKKEHGKVHDKKYLAPVISRWHEETKCEVPSCSHPAIWATKSRNVPWSEVEGSKVAKTPEEAANSEDEALRMTARLFLNDGVLICHCHLGSLLLAREGDGHDHKHDTPHALACTRQQAVKSARGHTDCLLQAEAHAQMLQLTRALGGNVVAMGMVPVNSDMGKQLVDLITKGKDNANGPTLPETKEVRKWLFENDTLASLGLDDPHDGKHRLH